MFVQIINFYLLLQILNGCRSKCDCEDPLQQCQDTNGLLNDDMNLCKWNAIEAIMGKDLTDKMRQGKNFTGNLDLTEMNSTLNKYGCEFIAPALAEMTGLKELDFDSCDIDDVGYRYLAPALAKMTGLKTLGLEANNLGNGDEDGRGIIWASDLAELEGLETLILDENSINDNDCEKLAPSLKKMKGLKELSISDNNISYTGLKYLVDNLIELEELEKLDLQLNVFGDTGYRYLADNLKKMKSLTILDISYDSNYISKQSKEYLEKKWEESGKNKDDLKLIFIK
tara:strand:+ start:125 stop:976 length:852 start_codon:yes stop_codon:yes gene_type:complete